MPRHRLLLTGALGYIAGQLAPAFGERYDLRRVDVRPAADAADAADDVIVADLLEQTPDELGHLFDGVDVVVHTAHHRPLALTPKAARYDYDGQRRNIDLMQRVYQLALDNGVRRVVAASTNQAAKWYEEPYFHGRRDRVSPEDFPRPDNFYGWAKAACEQLGFVYACGELGRKLEVIQIRIVVPREIEAELFANRGRERYIRELAGYVSVRDLQQLFCKSIETENIEDEHGVPFHVFYGVSNNARTFWSITNAREVIGYEPVDDSEQRYAEDIARTLYGENSS